MFAGKWDVFPAMAGLLGGTTPRMLLRCLAYTPMLILCGAFSFLPEIRGRRLRRAAPLLMVLSLAALAAQGYAPFVYFQF